MRVFSRTSLSGLSRLFHMIPESSTAIVTSGLPVVVFHACGASEILLPLWSTTHAPRTPFSSRLSALSGAYCGLGFGVDAYIQSSFPPRSFGAGEPAGSLYDE
jgi:hypothetical protein